MLVVRKERLEDVMAIYRINKEAFGGDTEADLVDRLRATGSLILSLVAIENQEVVGHIAFSLVRIDSTAGTKDAVGLGPLGVLPAYQNRCIGSEMVRVEPV